MALKGLKRAIAIVAAVAFLATVLGPIVPSAYAAEPCATMIGMPMGDDMQPAPSKGAMPACPEMSCIIMHAVLAALPQAFTDLAWSPVNYNPASAALTGRVIPPDQSPPRPSA